MTLIFNEPLLIGDNYVFNPDYPDKSATLTGSGGVESYMYSENSYGDSAKEGTVV